jgi:hypothetical protein
MAPGSCVEESIPSHENIDGDMAYDGPMLDQSNRLEDTEVSGMVTEDADEDQSSADVDVSHLHRVD